MAHGAVASTGLDSELVDAILRDPQSAPIDESLRATLRMLEELTLRPEAFGPATLSAMSATGLAPDAIEDAIAVCAHFTYTIRVADCLGFERPRGLSTWLSTKYLTGAGYAPEAFDRSGPQRTAAGWDAIVHDVQNAPGESDPAWRTPILDWVREDARTAHADDSAIPADLRTLVRRAAREAYRVDDAMIDELRAAGHTERLLFEVIALVAIGAGEARYRIGSEALSGVNSAQPF